MKLLNEMYGGVGGLDNFDRAIAMINAAVEHHDTNNNFEAIADIEGLVQYLKGHYHDFTPELEDTVRQIIADETAGNEEWDEAAGRGEFDEEEETKWHSHMNKVGRGQQIVSRPRGAKGPRWDQRPDSNKRFKKRLNKVGRGQEIVDREEEEESISGRIERMRRENKEVLADLDKRRQARKYGISGPSSRRSRLGSRARGRLTSTEQEETKLDKFKQERDAWWKEHERRKQARKYGISGPSSRRSRMGSRARGRLTSTEQEEQKEDNWHTDWNKEIEKFRERRQKNDRTDSLGMRQRLRARRRNTSSANPFSVEQEEVASLSDRRTRGDRFRPDVRMNRRGYRHNDPMRRRAQLMARKARPHVSTEEQEWLEKRQPWGDWEHDQEHRLSSLPGCETCGGSGYKRGGMRNTGSWNCPDCKGSGKQLPPMKHEQEEKKTDWNKEVSEFRKRRKTYEPEFSRGHSKLTRRRRSAGPSGNAFSLSFEGFKQFNEMYRDSQHGLTVDLSGPEGNAFVLLGYARKYAKELGWDPQPILDDMQSGDYEHLVSVFDKHFGNVITLINKPGEEENDYWNDE